MKIFKLKVFLGFYLSILSLGILQSCCEEELKITSEGGSMTAWELYETDKGGIGRRKISEFSGDFILGAYFVTHFASKSSPLKNFSLTNKSYAISCEQVEVNSIDENSLTISLDKIILLNNDSISAGNNLIAIPESGVIVHSVGRGLVEFRFTEEFFQNTTMTDSIYTFNFNGRTDDNIDLNSSISLKRK